MTDLTDFGGGNLPETSDNNVAHETRTDRAQHRRRLYRIGRCRAISKSKGTRCGSGIDEDSDGPLCWYHGIAHQPVTIDSDTGLVARWAGCRPTTWEEIPEACREALRALGVDE